METTVTIAGTIAIPADFELVTLSHLRTVDGAPVVVRCERLDEVVVSELLKAFPGANTPSVEDRNTEQDVHRMMTLAPRLIELGTVLADDDGGEIRPGFFYDETRRHAKSVPGSVLRAVDMLALANAVLRLNGFGGEAEGSFHGKERGGAGIRLDTVAHGEGDGHDAVASTP